MFGVALAPATEPAAADPKPPPCTCEKELDGLVGVCPITTIEEARAAMPVPRSPRGEAAGEWPASGACVCEPNEEVDS